MDDGRERIMERHTLDAWIEAAAAVLGLPAALDDRGAVLGNLERLAAVAARLDAVELAPEVEPATVFVR
jgi:hypothetical protein